MKGEISKETYEEWNRETGSEKLPERVKPKKTKTKSNVAKKKKTTTRAKAKTRKH